MTIQIRPRDNPTSPAYAPDRDIAHLFPRLVYAAAQTLTDEAVAAGDWPWRALGSVCPATLEATADRYFDFVRRAYLDADVPVPVIMERLRDAGLDERAMTVLLTAVGLAATSAYMRGVRKACSDVPEAELGAREIAEAMKLIQAAVSPGPWTRFVRFCRKASRWRPRRTAKPPVKKEPTDAA